MPRWSIADGAQVAGVTIANVQAVGDEVYRIATQHETLEPRVIVREAAQPTSPLHPVIFRIDDAAAALEHRLWIARSLLKSVRVVTEEGGETLERRVYVNVINGTSRGYMQVSAVMNNQVLREQLLAKAIADAQSWQIRYRGLNELSNIFHAIDAVLPLAQAEG